MKNVIIILISVNLVFALSACGSKSRVVLLPDPDGNVGKVIVANDKEQEVLTEANQSVQSMGRNKALGEVTFLSDAQIQADFSEVLSAEPQPPEKFILYFLQDSNELTAESKTVLNQIIQSIQKRASTDIVISGHTDTVGTNEYNYQLSLERARLMHNILVDNGAVPANITVTSHGEGNPLIKTADNVVEPRNRRVEVVIK